MFLRLTSATFALLVWLLAAAPILADELIVDNVDSSVQLKGKWTASSATPGYYGSDYLFRPPGDGSATVTWPFPANASAGRYEVFTRWSGGPNRADNVMYQVTSNAGTSSITRNQKLNGALWQSLGSFDFRPGKGQGVSISDKADGVVVADAIRWVGSQSGAAAPAPAQQAAAAPAAIPSSAPAPIIRDARYFDQTRYRIDEDAFWEYFQKRGGVRSFGYPVSNTFMLFGMKVQIFQRQILQLRPDGGVQTMNVLDEGLMPYTRINGSSFPAPDPSVIGGSPDPKATDYHEQTLQFVRDMAPDAFDGEPVNFARTFFSSVRAEDAYPGGVPDDAEGLLPYFNLEIWGLPTSKPTHDPSNPDFIYQRFQRGIMHYDKSCRCTQGLLLADYFKAILTKRNLPADLADQAKSSRFFGQYAPGQPQALARPNDLPGATLVNAFRRDPMVTLDAGHGGSEIGTSHTYPDGYVLQEKSLNLRVMLRVRELLQQGGYQVTVTRTTDALVNADRKDVNGDGNVTLQDDLQARVDTANNAGSDVFVSIHFNGISDPNIKGTYVFYDPDRPFFDRSKALADLIDQSVVNSMKDAGYVSQNHGPTTDTSVLGGAHYYLLSPKTDTVPRPSQMPAVIGEGLFLTNADDANALRNDATVEAIARGYAEGIKAYFAKFPPG
jgi:N-acetylmuramoyl-L-alanine amidase